MTTPPRATNHDRPSSASDRDSFVHIFYIQSPSSPSSSSSYRRSESSVLALCHALLRSDPIAFRSAVRCRNRDGDTMLQVASKFKMNRVVRLLLSHSSHTDMDIDATHAGGEYSALLFATRAGAIDVVKSLVESGADVSALMLTNNASRDKYLPKEGTMRDEVLSTVNTSRALYVSELSRILRDDMSHPFDDIPTVLLPIICGYAITDDYKQVKKKKSIVAIVEPTPVDDDVDHVSRLTRSFLLSLDDDDRILSRDR